MAVELKFDPKQPAIAGKLWKTDPQGNRNPFYFKLGFNGNGWLFGFAWSRREPSEVYWEGDGRINMTWAGALEQAIEYAKSTLGFKDVLIYGIEGEEYLD